MWMWMWMCTPRAEKLPLGLPHSRSIVCLFDKNHRWVNSLMIYDFCIPPCARRARRLCWPHPIPVSRLSSLGPYIIFAICLQLCRLLSSDTLIIDTRVSGQILSLWVFLRFIVVTSPDTFGKMFQNKNTPNFTLRWRLCVMRKWGEITLGR